MIKPPLRTAVYYSLLAVGFVLIDLVMDTLLFNSPSIFPHVIFTGFVVVASFIFLNRALAERQRAEDVLRQARDELENRVRQRTNELESANRALQIEIAEHQKADDDRKKMEQSLRESEERYRSLFDNFSEPTTVWSESGALLMQNLISARNLGGKREDFLGKKITEIFGPEGQQYMERISRVIKTGVAENQEDVVELYFGKRYFWSSMQRILNPDGQYTVQIISYDITDRKRTEEFLRASEEKFSTVFHFSPDAIAIIRSANGIFVDVNEAFTKLMGIPFSEVVGKSWKEINLYASIDEQNRVANLFAQMGMVADYELSFRNIKEDKATMLLSLIPITVSQEPSILVIAHDITEHKQSEEALRTVQAELAAGVQQRIALEERQRLARELHDSVSQAIYGISLGAHTALTLFETDREKVLEALNYVLSLAQAGLTEMRALIFELRPESLEMEGLIAAMTKQTAALRARYGVEVILNVCEEPEVSLNIKEAMYRIAQEALHNAIKHGRPSRIEINLFQEEGTLGLDVCDDGIGFNARAVFPGHLGLRSMQERAVGTHGTLVINSEIGRGTEIHSRIPIPGGQVRSV
jgi:PAS domain S-box-containing protein